jgi:hypothetical protein
MAFGGDDLELRLPCALGDELGVDASFEPGR